MGYFRLKLGLCGGARQGPQQEPGPLLAHYARCTHAEMQKAHFSLKIDENG
jgi:hypothetical protein